MRLLNIIESAYRGTLEEQDDTIVWLTHALSGAGADVTVLLRGAAVNYAVAEQDASGLSFGERRQTQPPWLPRDIVRLVERGATVYALEEDIAARGIQREELVDEVELIPAASVASLFEDSEQVWHW